MPFGDGTGPLGLGPGTGRGLGYCRGFGVPGFINPLGFWFGRGRGFWKFLLFTQEICICPVCGFISLRKDCEQERCPYCNSPLKKVSLNPNLFWFGRGLGFGRGRGRGFGFRRCWWLLPFFQLQPARPEQSKEVQVSKEAEKIGEVGLTKEQELNLLENELKQIEQEQKALKEEREEIIRRIKELKRRS
ncbi:MAG TPA: hypothetical protein ENF67_00955 [Candidatus Pacearchaeota archaeon]|nr:hypothetical protein [Candidatus Pacearchaeota archaeon]